MINIDEQNPFESPKQLNRSDLERLSLYHQAIKDRYLVVLILLYTITTGVFAYDAVRLLINHGPTTLLNQNIFNIIVSSIIFGVPICLRLKKTGKQFTCSDNMRSGSDTPNK